MKVYNVISLATVFLIHLFLVIDVTNSQGLPQVIIGFQQSSYTVNETEGSVTVCAELMSGQLGDTDSVKFRIITTRIEFTDSPAQPGSDYQNLNEMVEFDQDNMNEPICRDVGILQDDTIEDDEVFRVALRRISSTGVQVNFNPARATIVIIDDTPTTQPPPPGPGPPPPPPPVILFSMLPPPFSGDERNPGFVDLPIQVSVSPITAQLGDDIVVMVEVFGGTATDGVDFSFLVVNNAVNMVTFPRGTGNGAIMNARVRIDDDVLVEGTEMIVFLSTLPNAQAIAAFRQDRVNLPILDNDVTLGFQQARYVVNEGAGSVRICVQITSGQLLPGDTLSFELQVVDILPGANNFVPATGGLDYMNLPNGLVIVINQGNMNQPQCLDILIIDDNDVEPVEHFAAQLDVFSVVEIGVELVNLLDVRTLIAIIDNDEEDNDGGGGGGNGGNTTITVPTQPRPTQTMPAGMMPNPTKPPAPTPAPTPAGPGCPPLSCIICNNYGHGSYMMTTEPPIETDPCSEQQPCDFNAICMNGSGGSFTCTCIPPFVGDGFTCSTLDSGPVQTPAP